MAELRLEKVIYAETDPSQLAELLQHFVDELPGGIENVTAAGVISVIQDAWNYLPHKRLGERSPAELMNDLNRTGKEDTHNPS